MVVERESISSDAINKWEFWCMISFANSMELFIVTQLSYI